MQPKNTKEKRTISAVVVSPMLDVVEQLHEKGYTDTEIVRQGIRLLARREKVAA